MCLPKMRGQTLASRFFLSGSRRELTLLMLGPSSCITCRARSSLLLLLLARWSPAAASSLALLSSGWNSLELGRCMVAERSEALLGRCIPAELMSVPEAPSCSCALCVGDATAHSASLHYNQSVCAFLWWCHSQVAWEQDNTGVAQVNRLSMPRSLRNNVRHLS